MSCFGQSRLKKELLRNRAEVDRALWSLSTSVMDEL